MTIEKPAYRSEIAGAVHEMVAGFESVGVVSKTTLRQFNGACLIQVDPLATEEIRALREREAMSQPVFAAYLNVSRNLVSDWERGVKRPGGPSLRLLSIVERRGFAAIA